MKRQIFILIIGIFIFNGCKQNFSEIIFSRHKHIKIYPNGIYMMNSKGRNQTCILEDREKVLPFVGSFSCSPDGKKIAFSLGKMEKEIRYDKNDKIIFDIYITGSDIYIKDIDKNKNPIRITKDIIAGQPAWSPDSKKIVFRVKEANRESIYLINIDGTNQKKLINFEGGTILGLSLSSDDKKIAFDLNKNGNYDIYIIDIDGSNLVQLTNTPMDECTPAWSPDGKKIAFGSRDGLYIMDSNGKNQRKITDSPLFFSVLGISWSPDGKRLVFGALENNTGANDEIFIVGIDGKNLKNLTNTKDYSERFPSWRPIVKD